MPRGARTGCGRSKGDHGVQRDGVVRESYDCDDDRENNEREQVPEVEVDVQEISEGLSDGRRGYFDDPEVRGDLRDLVEHEPTGVRRASCVARGRACSFIR